MHSTCTGMHSQHDCGSGAMLTYALSLLRWGLRPQPFCAKGATQLAPRPVPPARSAFPVCKTPKFAMSTPAEPPASKTTELKEVLFRSFVKADGSTPFQPEAGRYRLYISLACPWASRTFMTLKLKGLEDAIPVTVVYPHLTDLCVMCSMPIARD
jgi:Glutathione S-transferase, N-terminal domain